MSEEIKDIILDVKDSLNETPKNMYKYNKITLNLNEFEEILNYIEKLEKENFNIRENIHLERISLPPALTKDKDFMELYDIPSYEDLQQKVEQLEKENKELKYDCSCSFHDAEELNQELTEIIDERNELDTKLIQLENIRKEAIEYINKNWGHWCSNHYKYATETINILNKGDNKK